MHYARQDMEPCYRNYKESIMATKELMDKLSIYIPQSKQELKPVERLMALGAKRDRSVNYLVCEAIIEYLDREEKKKK